MNPRITKTSNLGVLDGVEGEFLPCNCDEGATETSGHSEHRYRSGSERLDRKPDSTGVVEVQPVGKRFVPGERVWLHPGHRLQIRRSVLAPLSSRREPTFAYRLENRRQRRMIDRPHSSRVGSAIRPENTKDVPGDFDRTRLIHRYQNLRTPLTLPCSRKARIVRLVFSFIFKVIRFAFVGAIGAALAAKVLLESNADVETEEIDLVAILEGKELVSSADPFYGGKVLAMFGGVLLDLRKTQPAPTGIRIDLAVIMGGVSLVVPEGWRVRFEGKMFMGGWSDNTRTTAEEDVPTVTITGFVACGGLQATTMSPVEAVV
jgi:hypothetical protein